MCMADNEEKQYKLIPYVDSYFRNGICLEDLSLNESERQQMKIVLKAFDIYKTTPWFDNFRKFFVECGCSQRMVRINLMLLNYIKENYSGTTRCDARNMFDFAVKTALQSAASAGDRAALIRAGQLMMKGYKLDQPDPEDDEARRVSRLDFVFTPKVEAVDPERKTVDDKSMRAILKKYGGVQDKMQESIDEKVERLVRHSDDGTNGVSLGDGLDDEDIE